MRRLVLIGLASGIAAVAVAGSGAGAPVAATRVVDRTFVCTPDLQAGVRTLYVIAQSGFRENATRWKWLPSVVLSTDGVEGPGPQSTSVAGISAGVRDELGPARTWVGVDRCKPSNARVPLSRSGLPARSSDVLGDTYGCVAPQRVLLRIRVAFAQPTALVRNGTLGQLRAQAPVQSATLALRRLDGRPFAFATVAKGGATRFWAGRACTD